jgi:hypothetical protein
MKKLLINKSFCTILTWLIVSGCLCMPSSLPFLEKVTNTPGSTSTLPPETPTLQLTPTPTDEITSEDVPTEFLLSPQGPWLIISTSNGLWAANQDGSNLTQFTSQEMDQRGLSKSVQPGGNRFAFITSSANPKQNLELHLLSLPEGKIEKVSSLLPSDFEMRENDIGPGDPRMEAIRAISDLPALAWSPDGKTLAFIGYMDGDSADLYLYNTETHQITRVTQDSYQNFSPAWTPDGKFVLVFGAESFGTGAGYNMAGAWSASSDGSNLTWLYESDSGGEELIGWSSETSAVLASWNAICGSAMLRHYDIQNTQTTVLYEDCFLQAAADGHGTVMFTTEKGLYLSNAINDNTPELLLEKPATRIDWVPGGWTFTAYFRDGSAVSYSPEGEKLQDSPITVSNSWQMQVAEYGAIWAWTSMDEQIPGVWTSGPGLPIQQVFEFESHIPIWDKDNNLLFFNRDMLYKTTFPDYNDAALLTQITGEVFDMTWMMNK